MEVTNMQTIVNAIGLWQTIVIALCVGYLLGMLTVILWDRLPKKVPGDYVDWSKIPDGYNYVGINGKNTTVWMSKTELSHDNHNLYLESLDNSITLCPEEAISGPIPKWRESIRRRPL